MQNWSWTYIYGTEHFHNHKNEPFLKGSQSFGQTWQTPSFMETQRLPRLKDPATVPFPKTASLIWTKPPNCAAEYSFNHYSPTLA